MAPCIFCRGDASTSRSVAHVIPASLGNNDRHGSVLTLDPGVECDACNSFFGRSIESHFLSRSCGLLSRRHAVPNRRGAFPATDIEGRVELPDGRRRRVKRLRVTPAQGGVRTDRAGEVEFSFWLRWRERRYLTSAFLCKLAIEFVARERGRDVALRAEYDEHRSNARRPSKDAWLPFYRAVLPPLLGSGLQLALFDRGLLFVVQGWACFLPWSGGNRDTMADVMFRVAPVSTGDRELTIRSTLSHPSGLRQPGEGVPAGRLEIKVRPVWLGGTGGGEDALTGGSA